MQVAGRRRLPGWARSLLALVVALAVLRGLEGIIAPAPLETDLATARPPDLRRWDYLGCYDLQAEPWRFSRYVASLDSAGRALLKPPDRVILLPDSLDEWGRGHGTMRATPLDAEDRERIGRSLHWFVRADTLWLLWSVGPSRVGVALFASADSLVGQGVAIRADSAQGTASAGAWRINCSTLERDRAGRLRR